MLRTRIASVLVALACVLLSSAAQTYSPPNVVPHTIPQQGKSMHATGTFEVKVTPVDPSPIAQQADLGRMTIDKSWSGDLSGTSQGEMLTGLTKGTGSMSYVAMERVNATLAGRTGTFLFCHVAHTQAGATQGSGLLNIAVVPNSGTAALAGITGSLTLNITTDKVHHYEFTYTLPNSH